MELRKFETNLISWKQILVMTFLFWLLIYEHLPVNFPKKITKIEILILEKMWSANHWHLFSYDWITFPNKYRKCLIKV